MIRKPGQSVVHGTIVVRNYQPSKIKVIIEPWANEYDLLPVEELEIIYSGPNGGLFEIESKPGQVILYGWEGSIVYVKDGFGLPQPFPATPPGPPSRRMETAPKRLSYTFLDLLEKVVRQRCPALSGPLNSRGILALPKKDLLRIAGSLADERCASGLQPDREPNDRGLQLQKLIDYLQVRVLREDPKKEVPP